MTVRLLDSVWSHLMGRAKVSHFRQKAARPGEGLPLRGRLGVCGEAEEKLHFSFEESHCAFQNKDITLEQKSFL